MSRRAGGTRNSSTGAPAMALTMVLININESAGFCQGSGSSGNGFRSFIISLPIRAKAEAVLEVKPFICVVFSHKIQVGRDS